MSVFPKDIEEKFKQRNELIARARELDDEVYAWFNNELEKFPKEVRDCVTTLDKDDFYQNDVCFGIILLCQPSVNIELSLLNAVKEYREEHHLDKLTNDDMIEIYNNCLKKN